MFRFPQQVVFEQIERALSSPSIQGLPVGAFVKAAIAARWQTERGLISVL